MQPPAITNQREQYLQEKKTLDMSTARIVDQDGNEMRFLPYDEKDYICRHCRVAIYSKGIPDGWYALKKSHGPDQPLKMQVIVCSFTCLLLYSANIVKSRLDSFTNERGY